MKKILTLGSMMLALLLSTTPTYAEDYGIGFDPYVAVGVGTVNIKQTGTMGAAPNIVPMLQKNYQPYIYAAMGVQLHKYFAVEMRYGATKSDASTANLNNINTPASIDYMWSLFVKPQVYMTDKASVYGLLGGTTLRYAGPGVGSPAINTTVASMETSGLSYGLGLNYDANEEFSIAFEALRYINATVSPPVGNDLTIDSYSAVLKYRF